jgi:hypothetical protein
VCGIAKDLKIPVAKRRPRIEECFQRSAGNGQYQRLDRVDGPGAISIQRAFASRNRTARTGTTRLVVSSNAPRRGAKSDASPIDRDRIRQDVAET